MQNSTHLLVMSAADRRLLDQLGQSLYEANLDEWHCSQENTFGIIAEAIFDVAIGIIKRELIIEDLGDVRGRLANGFYASFDGNNTGTLIEELINWNLLDDHRTRF